jgi:hypothetical protein
MTLCDPQITTVEDLSYCLVVVDATGETVANRANTSLTPVRSDGDPSLDARAISYTPRS